MRRRMIRLLKGSVDAEIRQRQSAEICSQLTSLEKWKIASKVCLFASMDHEVDSRFLIQSALESGKECFLPRVISDEEMRFFRVFDLKDQENFAKNSWGIAEPPEESRRILKDQDSVDIVVCPGVAFDKFNRRLGYGKGYYDRAISKFVNRPWLVGIAFSFQVVEEVPVDKFDQTLDLIIAPKSAK